MFASIVASNIAKARVQAGIKSQSELGIRLNFSQNAIHQYETGKRQPSLNTIERIAEVTKKPISWFFEEHPEEVQEIQPAPDIKRLPDSSHNLPDNLDPSVIEYLERRIGLLEAKFEEEKTEISQQLKKQNQVLEQFLTTQNNFMENFLMTVSGELREIKKNLSEAEQWSKINIHLEGNEASQENSERMI